MKINSVECEQFAGLQDKKIEFKSGLNIITGDNECGKSTIVDLIYTLFFKSSKLDGRCDAEFIDKYFPKRVNGLDGDVIDGTIIFETEDGIYKLKKEWEKGEGSCRLTLPDGTSIKKMSTISALMNDMLKHRAGVYSEIVFAAQKRNQIAIESIMKSIGKKSDPLSDTKEDMKSILTQAVLETGGVSIEKIEKEINMHLDNLSGRWDFDTDSPEGGRKRASYKNAWLKGAGEIVQAYYSYDEVKSKQIDTENIEKEIELEKENINKIVNKKDIIVEKRDKFLKFRGTIDQISLLKNSIKDTKSKIERMKEDYVKWPESCKKINIAKDLSAKLEQVMAYELYVNAKVANDSYCEKKKLLENLKEIDAEDIRRLSNLLSQKQIEENKLAGININAKINKLGENPINIESLANGSEIALNSEVINITEAIKVSVPGVMEMELFPNGVNVSEVNESINKLNIDINQIYQKYEISDIEMLREMSDLYISTKQEVERLKLKLDNVLGNKTWDEVVTANKLEVNDIKPEKEIRRELSAICGNKTIDSFIGGLETIVEGYESTYETMDRLKELILSRSNDLEKYRRQINSVDEIPDEYKYINDADEYETSIKLEISVLESQLENHNNILRELEIKLGEKSAEEYSDELRERKAILDYKKNEYNHWKNIHAVFSKIKKETSGNPIEGIEKKFNEYLSVITSGGVKLESMNDKMDVNLSSGVNALTYDILSDGTKDTISLAFRLAMLEQLYPEGEGLAIFDDPFTDMDDERVSQACGLIQKFSERNQVIFTTCNRKYNDLLSGNKISISK